MYKKQVKLQKIFCYLALIASALVFVYSLGLVTDLYDSLYTAMYETKDFQGHIVSSSMADITEYHTEIAGAKIYYDIQPFNHYLMLAGIGLILLAVGVIITQTHKRRRYYVGNYVSVAIWAVASLATTLWAHTKIEGFKRQFLTEVNFDQMEAYAKEFNQYSTRSTFWFDAHYFVFGLVLVAVAIMVANVFWKRSLMTQEAKLLAGNIGEASNDTVKVQ